MGEYLGLVRIYFISVRELLVIIWCLVRSMDNNYDEFIYITNSIIFKLLR